MERSGPAHGVVYKEAVPFCSDLSDGVNCRMPQSKRNRRNTFMWEEVMQTVPGMANLFEEILSLKNFIVAKIKVVNTVAFYRSWSGQRSCSMPGLVNN